jgi:hypothetical protein
MSREILLALALLAPAAPAGQPSGAFTPAAGPAPRAPADAPPGTVTLPLADLLELRRASQAAASAVPPAPPVRATVNRFEIAGRLLDTGLDATAQVELTVVSTGWVTVPLLDVRRGTQLEALPSVEGGVVAAIDGRLCFVTDQPGTHAFSLRWLERASTDARTRTLDLRVARGAPAVLRLQYDEGLFRLATDSAREDGAAAVVHASDGRIAVAWEQLARPRPRAREAARPPVEPVVTQAHASVVATLDGRRITRVQYRLRFEGERTFAVALPQGHAVERVFLNGAARPFTRAGDAISLPVQPARAGDQNATVEVVTSELRSGYPLSGTLAFALPQPAWGVNDLFATLHLPTVFEYRWAGGSLANVEEAPPVDFAWAIPAPGRVVALRQQLVSSIPTVRVAYTVDLASSYYR